jgi:hypothetical protein
MAADRCKRECGRGDRNCEVVQRTKGLWLHPARRRRQGRVRPYLGCERAGLSNLNEGAKVSYEEQENRGKTSAENLRVG